MPTQEPQDMGPGFLEGAACEQPQVQAFTNTTKHRPDWVPRLGRLPVEGPWSCPGLTPCLPAKGTGKSSTLQS